MKQVSDQFDNDADDFLLSSGQGGGKAAKFDRIGQIYSGVIVAPPKKVVQTDIATKQPKLSKFTGQPLYQVLVRIQTELREDNEDDGIRTLYVKNKMTAAVGDAMRKAGVTRLEVGGLLRVGYTRDIPPETPGYRPSKDFAAEYIAPAVKAADDFFAQSGAPVSPPPAAQAQQVSEAPRLTTLQQLQNTSFNAQGQPQDQAPPF